MLSGKGMYGFCVVSHSPKGKRVAYLFERNYLAKTASENSGGEVYG